MDCYAIFQYLCNIHCYHWCLPNIPMRERGKGVVGVFIVNITIMQLNLCILKSTLTATITH